VGTAGGGPPHLRAATSRHSSCSDASDEAATTPTVPPGMRPPHAPPPPSAGRAAWASRSRGAGSAAAGPAQPCPASGPGSASASGKAASASVRWSEAGVARPGLLERRRRPPRGGGRVASQLWRGQGSGSGPAALEPPGGGRPSRRQAISTSLEPALTTTYCPGRRQRRLGLRFTARYVWDAAIPARVGCRHEHQKDTQQTPEQPHVLTALPCA